jgi:hypothetical protein
MGGGEGRGDTLRFNSLQTCTLYNVHAKYQIEKYYLIYLDVKRIIRPISSAILTFINILPTCPVLGGIIGIFFLRIQR